MRPVRQEPPRRPRRVPADGHGFDEFFGNLYHLNAEEEPENADYPKDPEFKKKFGPRGVLHAGPTPTARQKIEDTGPLTTKRMETVDEEILDASAGLHRARPHKDDKPFFCWWNSTRMHIFTHLKKESQGKTGLGVYPDGMVEHDGHVGQLLDKLDELGIADNTIVMYSTDNGAEVMSWPDGGTTPFRGEKDTNWEGGWRVPCVIRWPGVHQARHGRQRHLLAPGHAADAARGRRRAGHRRETQEGLHGRREDLQGPHRRLQPAAVPEGRGEGEPAPGLPVLERRRRPDGAALGHWKITSWNSARKGSTCGRNRSCRCGSRSSSTCGPTRSRRADCRRHLLQEMAESTASSCWYRPAARRQVECRP